jgi:hypothetical protein
MLRAPSVRSATTPSGSHAFIVQQTTSRSRRLYRCQTVALGCGLSGSVGALSDQPLDKLYQMLLNRARQLESYPALQIRKEFHG